MNTDNNHKFKHKYRTTSARLKYYDYSSNGGYFITICTKNCTHYFGSIDDGKIQLTEIGIQADKCWQEIPSHFPFVVQDSYIIMPNHIHGIIIIDKTVETQNLACNHVETQNLACNNKETQYLASLQQQGKPKFNKFGPQSGNLGSIIRGFKIGVKKWALQNNIQFDWQSRFYDHIIRNVNELNRIRKYIIDNPLKWELEQNNPENLFM